MFRWMALGGCIWLAALALFVAGIQRAAVTPRLSQSGGTALVRELNEAQTHSDERWWNWRVTRATSAHRVLVVDVEARRPAEARAIAIQIVEPVLDDGYDEILIYVREANSGNGPVARRVQWTPRRGYSELVMSD